MAGFEHVVVIGASAGGVAALIEIARGLPRDFAAPVCIVQHVGGNPSLLPELLAFHGPNPAVHAVDGQELHAGTLYVAPPDHHMLIFDGHVQLTRGAKENHTRPAIDPLFRSAAVDWGPCLIGIILTGMMDDGTAGLRAVEDCGGTTIVQDPRTAVEGEMPASAMRYVDVDHCVQLGEIAGLLQQLVARPARAADAGHEVPSTLHTEVAINRGENTMENLAVVAMPSTLTCPECHGSLWEVQGQQPLRYRCHIGHAYSVRTLDAAQANAADEAVWGALRILREREMLVRRLASIAAATGDRAQAEAGKAQAERLHSQIEALTGTAEATGVGSAAGVARGSRDSGEHDSTGRAPGGKDGNA